MQVRHQAHHVHCCQQMILFFLMHACHLCSSYVAQLHCTACRCRSMRAVDQFGDHQSCGLQMISHAHLHNFHQQHCQSCDSSSRMIRGFAHHVERTHNLMKNDIFNAKPVKPTVECDMLHIPCLGIVMSLKNSTFCTVHCPAWCPFTALIYATLLRDATSGGSHYDC